MPTIIWLKMVVFQAIYDACKLPVRKKQHLLKEALQIVDIHCFSTTHMQNTLIIVISYCLVKTAK